MTSAIKKFSGVLILLFSVLQSMAQTAADQKKEDLHMQLKKMVDSRQYRFRAMSATSQKGRTVQLQTEYILQVKDDSLNVDLPYYGQSYMSSYPATDQGIRFETKSYTYTSDSTKKGSWEILIQPNGQSAASKMYISIGSSGYATVRVLSANRSPISYYGNIVPYNFR